jgi:retron-type reverse transcriptase
MTETQSSLDISTKLERIAKTAKEKRGVSLLALAHHIDVDWLREAYRRTRKDGARGVDGQSAASYAEHLEANLQSLLDRAKSGRYRAPPVRRVHIPKGNGTETRPIGIPTFEDKVLQRAVAMVIGEVYEQEFYDFSYGFRPGRSPHQALRAVQNAAWRMAGGGIVEVDIRKFFDTVGHSHLREILRRRIGDGVLLRLIGKWLNAGVLEGLALSYPDEGTPQGGVISPLLANIYLHEVLDQWFVRDVQPALAGRAELFRFADDFAASAAAYERSTSRRDRDPAASRPGRRDRDPPRFQSGGAITAAPILRLRVVRALGCHVATRARAAAAPPHPAVRGEPARGLGVKAPSLRSRFAALTPASLRLVRQYQQPAAAPHDPRQLDTLPVPKRHGRASMLDRYGDGRWITIPPTSPRTFEATVDHYPAEAIRQVRPDLAS